MRTHSSRCSGEGGGAVADDGTHRVAPLRIRRCEQGWAANRRCDRGRRTEHGESSDEFSSLLHQGPLVILLSARTILAAAASAPDARSPPCLRPNDMATLVEQRPRGDPRRPDPGRRDLLPVAVRDRRARAVRPAVLLRLHGARLRLDARPGHVGQRDQQADRRPAVRLRGGLVRRPVRAATPDDRRHPDGGHRARRTRVDQHADGLLHLLPVQRARERARRSAAEPGAALALVQRGARPRDGLRLSRHRPRRRARAARRVPALAGVRMARRRSRRSAW